MIDKTSVKVSQRAGDLAVSGQRGRETLAEQVHVAKTLAEQGRRKLKSKTQLETLRSVVGGVEAPFGSAYLEGRQVRFAGEDSRRARFLATDERR
jgi:hypothetical protein